MLREKTTAIGEKRRHVVPPGMPHHLRCNGFGEIQILLCEQVIEILPEYILAVWDGLREDGRGARGELPAFIEQRRDIVVRCGEGRRGAIESGSGDLRNRAVK